jgi:pyruvate carboxylase
VRLLYAPFESGLRGPTGRIYRTEIPGGQLSNLRQQANSLGLGERFEDVEEMYAAANRILGNIVKVTPSSKVVGDLALALVGRNADPADFEEHPDRYDIPDSVIGFLNGDLGTPPGGWPEPFRTKALAGRVLKPVVAELSSEDSADLAAHPRHALNRLLFPGPLRDYEDAVEAYSALSVVPTWEFLHGIKQGHEVEVVLEKGHSLELGISAIGDPDDHGMRQVLCSVNGQPRTLSVRDTSVDSSVPTAEKADKAVPGQIPAPFAGVITPVVEVGDEVTAGQQVAVIEAMKMEAAITTPVAGVVKRWAVGAAQSVEGGDLLLVID